MATTALGGSGRRRGRRKTLLRVTGLKVAYGGIQAVKGVSFEVHEGELVSLIGANGAGKTTTLKAITGTQAAAGGEIEFMGRSIRGQGPWDLVKQGLVMVPEGRGVFARMTITENLQMGAFVRNDVKEIAADVERVFAIFPRLKERRHQLAGTMSGGEQQMLAMGRALMARPKVLLMDEPSMGLSPIMVDKIFEVVSDIHSPGHDDPARRAEREPGAPARLARLRHGQRRGDDERRRQGAPRRPEGSRRLPRRVASAPSQRAAVSAPFLLVVTSVGSRDEANRIARTLVEQRLAACAQISAIDSYYVWEDAVRARRRVPHPVQGRGRRVRRGRAGDPRPPFLRAAGDPRHPGRAGATRRTPTGWWRIRRPQAEPSRIPP